MRDMIGMMLNGQAPDTTAYRTIATIPEKVDQSSYASCYFDRNVHGEKVAMLSTEIRNLVKTDMAQRVRGKFQMDAEAVGDGTQRSVEDEGVGDRVADDVDMEGDLDDFGGETEARQRHISAQC